MTYDPAAVEFGLDTFGDVQSDVRTGELISPARTIANVVEEAKLADSLGIGVFGIGEHHRADYAVSAPDMLLAAIAGQTETIRLTTSVIVLSSDDPVRIFERFSTLQALSRGRAEITVGRGSFIESFPLFGYSLDDYAQLFEEKLDLLAALLAADAAGEPVTWEAGRMRAGIDNLRMHPPLETPLPAWVAVGGSPESVVRAARYRMPLMLAIIGGAPDRFKPFVDLFHRTNRELGNPDLPVGVHSYGLVADSDAEAQEILYPHWEKAVGQIGSERGWSRPTPTQFMQEIRYGAMHVGSPDTVAQKIARTVSRLGLNRFTMKYSNGPIPHEHLTDSIRLYGEEVIPRVRRLLAKER